MKNGISLIIPTVLICLFAAQAYSEKNASNRDAVSFVEEWLLLIDQDNYVETWGFMSDIFKRTVTEKQWLEDLENFRKPLGKVFERKLLYQTKSSDETLGKYLIIQYKTQFENRISKGEAVSIIKDSEGRWKILGYTVF